MLQQVAQWNQKRDVWETGEADLFSGHLDVFSETFPKSGTTRNGVLFLRPALEHPTGENGFSLSPGLPTPRASEHKASTSAPAALRHVESGMGSLAEVVGYYLLPTPRTNDHTGPGEHGRGGRDLRTEIAVTDFAKFEPAVARWGGVMSRESPAPTVANLRGKQQLSGRFVEWMMGLPAGWVTDPDIGLSRAQQLKALGNGVVPQQAAFALRGLIKRRHEN